MKSVQLRGWVSLAEAALYSKLNGTSGHFSPQTERMEGFVYAFVVAFATLLEPKYKPFWQNAPPSEINALPPWCSVFQGTLVHLCFLFSFVCVFPAPLGATCTPSNTWGVCFFVGLLSTDCCQAKDQYIEQFKDTLSTCVGKSIAGFFAEPIQVSMLAWDINWVYSYEF